MKNNPLGKTISFKSQYDPELLFPIPRDINRKQSGITEPVFKGYDIWNCYEFSWLNLKGKPEVRRVTLTYSAFSNCIVESKSLKLYLGSFSMTPFKSEEEVKEVIATDLKKVLGTEDLILEFYDWSHPLKYTAIPSEAVIDDLDIEVDIYNQDSSLLVKEEGRTSEILISNLLKSDCPITTQPDWATVIIRYESDFAINKESLLKYIISYRLHADYHEACCEKIFYDLFNLLRPEKLMVKCMYTRRGGIDIAPCRFYGEEPDNLRTEHYWRQ